MKTRFKQTKAAPCCGHPIDAAAGIWDEVATPSPGDITICINCGELLVFTDAEGSLREARAGDLMQLDESTRIALKEAKEYIKQRGRI